jgi:hypothetical protein
LVAQRKIEVAVSIGVAAAYHRKLRFGRLAHWEKKRRLRSQNVNYGSFDFEVFSSVLMKRTFLRIFRMPTDSFHRLISIWPNVMRHLQAEKAV